MRVKRKERGWAGHFILADRCRFRRNTLLTCGKVEVVVSTVGAMLSCDEIGFETIGADRYYETMAFHAKAKDKKYHDMDVEREVSFKSNWALDKLDSENEANDMHEAVVKEIARKLKKEAMKCSL